MIFYLFSSQEAQVEGQQMQYSVVECVLGAPEAQTSQQRTPLRAQGQDSQEGPPMQYSVVERVLGVPEAQTSQQRKPLRAQEQVAPQMQYSVVEHRLEDEVQGQGQGGVQLRTPLLPPAREDVTPLGGVHLRVGREPSSLSPLGFFPGEASFSNETFLVERQEEVDAQPQEGQEGGEAQSQEGDFSPIVCPLQREPPVNLMGDQ